MTHVDEVQEYLPNFLAQAMQASVPEIDQITKDPWTALDDVSKPVQNLIKELISSAYVSIAWNHQEMKLESLAEETMKTLKAEVSEVVGELLDEGVIEVKPIYLLKLNTEKAMRKRQLAIKNFPSPDLLVDLMGEMFGHSKDKYVNP